MTNLVTLHVEESQQVRGQRRKLTKALIVVPTPTPMSNDSCNLPVIVLEALKDILFDFPEARTRRQAWRPMAAISIAQSSYFMRISAHINWISFPRLSISLVTQNTSPFLREVPPH